MITKILLAFGIFSVIAIIMGFVMNAVGNTKGWSKDVKKRYIKGIVGLYLALMGIVVFRLLVQ